MRLFIILILLLFSIVFSTQVSGQSFFDCISNSFETKNELSPDLKKNGFWIEKAKYATSLGFYSMGQKLGFWLSVADSSYELQSISYYRFDGKIFEMTNSNDSLHLYNNTSDTVNQRIFQEFKSGDNIISLNDYFDPRDKRKVRISFNGLPSLSKYANELIIDFPYSDNSKIHINFWNYGSDVSADFKGLTLKSIKKVTDGRYQGIHYFLNPYGRYFTNLRYKDGWVHGSSVIFRWKSKTLIGEFEMGRIQSMPMLFYKSDTIIKVSDGKLSKEDISFYIGLIIRKNLPNYLGVHEDCSSCILEYFNGFYGIDLLGLGISPDIWDLEERGIASGNYPLPKKDYTREETKKMLKMRSTIEGKFNK